MRTTICVLIIAVATACLADTTFVSGAVSGVWDTSGSPYILIDNTTIPDGETLVIGPGVDIIFECAFCDFSAIGPLIINGDSVFSVSIRGSGYTAHHELNGYVEGDYCIFENLWMYFGGEIKNSLFRNMIFIQSLGGIIKESQVINDSSHSITLASGRFVNCLINLKSESSLICGSEVGGNIYLVNSTIIIPSGTTSGAMYMGGFFYTAYYFNSIFIGEAETDLEEVGFYYSLVYGTPVSLSAIFVDTIQGLPSFLEPDSSDYRLSDSSIAIGAGTTSCFMEIMRPGGSASAPSIDILGNPRPNPLGSMPDLGCYENALAFPAPIGETPTSRPSSITISSYPNPFNSAVKISVCQAGTPDLPVGQDSAPVIEIFDINGRMVFETPVGATRRVARAGQPLLDPYEYVWIPDEPIASGVYLVRIKGTNASAKIIYMK